MALIRPMTADDIEAVSRVLQREGGRDRRRQLTFYVEHPDCHPLVAEENEEIVGTALGTQGGHAGWIGAVFVAPEHRGRGLGTRLAQTAVEQLEALGCRTLVLLATELGRPIYERLGFRVETFYYFFEGPSLPSLPSHPRLRRVRPNDLAAIEALDRQATGEERSRRLRSLAHDGWVVTSPDEGSVRGFYLPTPWLRGPAVALDPEDGALLLDLTRAVMGREGRSALLALPAENPAGHRYLRQAGFVTISREPRMARGEPLLWQPNLVWGQFNLAMG